MCGKLLKHNLFSCSMVLALAAGMVMLCQNNAYLIKPFLQGSIPNFGIYMDFYFSALDAGGFLIFTPLLAVLPGVIRFCDEYQSGYIRFILTRQKQIGYVRKHIIATALSGGCAVALPLLLFAVLTILFCEPYTPESLASGHHTPVFGTLMGPLELTWGGLACIPVIIACAFLFGIVWSTVGLAVAAIYPNRYLALCVPLLLFFFLHLGSNALGLYLYSPVNMILPDVLPSYWFLILYQSALLTVALIVLFLSMKRRLSYV